MTEILRVENLNKTFTKKSFLQSKSDITTAVRNVSFSLKDDEILAIAGQSGSGKSTIAKLILRAIIPDSLHHYLICLSRFSPMQEILTLASMSQPIL